MATPPKKPTTPRRRSTRRPAAETGAGPKPTSTSDTTADSADAAKPTRARRVTKAADATTPRAAPARRKAAPRKATSAAQKKAVIASAPHNAVHKVSATARRAKEKSPFGLKTAIAAGIGAVGAVATAAILTLRGSTPKDPPALPPPADTGEQSAHQADGTDASASFNAGIADEGTIPGR